jgi:hypothetical protein
MTQEMLVQCIRFYDVTNLREAATFFLQQSGKEESQRNTPVNSIDHCMIIEFSLVLIALHLLQHCHGAKSAIWD